MLTLDKPNSTSDYPSINKKEMEHSIAQKLGFFGLYSDAIAVTMNPERRINAIKKFSETILPAVKFESIDTEKKTITYRKHRHKFRINLERGENSEYGKYSFSSLTPQVQKALIDYIQNYYFDVNADLFFNIESIEYILESYVKFDRIEKNEVSDTCVKLTIHDRKKAFDFNIETKYQNIRIR